MRHWYSCPLPSARLAATTPVSSEQALARLTFAMPKRKNCEEMAKKKPKALQSQPPAQVTLNCDPDPMADVFYELQEDARFRAQHPPAADPIVSARVEAVRTAYDVKKAEIAAESEAPAEPMIWKGPVYELARHIETIFRAGHLTANSSTDAFKRACKHYVQPDGSPFSAESLGQSLRQKRDAERGEQK